MTEETDKQKKREEVKKYKDKYTKETYILTEGKFVREESPTRDSEGKIIYKRKDKDIRFNKNIKG